MLSQIRTIFSVVIIMALLLGSGLLLGEQTTAAADGEKLNLPPIELPDKGNPKLDSQLNQLVSAEISRKAAGFAQESNIELVEGNVRVIVESDMVGFSGILAFRVGVEVVEVVVVVEVGRVSALMRSSRPSLISPILLVSVTLASPLKLMAFGGWKPTTSR